MAEGWDAPVTDWIGEVKMATNKEILSIAKQAFDKIRARTPVVTGKLKAAWVFEEMVNEGLISVSIVNKEEYVLMIEYGTVATGGRYMVERTINELVEGGA